MPSITFVCHLLIAYACTCFLGRPTLRVIEWLLTESINDIVDKPIQEDAYPMISNDLAKGNREDNIVLGLWKTVLNIK